MPAGSRARSKCISIVAWICFGIFAAASGVQGQPVDSKGSASQLEDLSKSVQNLGERVSPSVVRIVVTRYGPRNANDWTVVGWQQSFGSGLIVDPDGYILTNAHVVEGARKISVNLVRAGKQTVVGVGADTYSEPQDATLVGLFQEADLALLKIAASGLPTLPFADNGKLRQGQIVFAFGSPEGLQNSMSMGIVSSIARQLDPDSPFTYIQTDAPINPGNSGGPLINTAGEIVGLDTFIVSKSGGSEGIGFAIPSVLLKWVFEQLRKYGHVHRPVTGMRVQTITPTLASALKLPRDFGIMVCDVLPGSPADSAGLKINDVLLSVNGRLLDSVPAMMEIIFAYAPGEHLKFEVQRGNEELSVNIEPVEDPRGDDRLARPGENESRAIPELGVLASDVGRQSRTLLNTLRRPFGVIVVARIEGFAASYPELQVGDVIHEINGCPIPNLGAMDSELARLKRGAPVALLIERSGQLLYIPFQLE